MKKLLEAYLQVYLKEPEIQINIEHFQAECSQVTVWYETYGCVSQDAFSVWDLLEFVYENKKL